MLHCAQGKQMGLEDEGDAARNDELSIVLPMIHWSRQVPRLT